MLVASMSGLLQLPVGSVCASDFRVLRPLSEGGMGAVYVVEQLSTGRKRALKVMQPGLVSQDKLRERFTQEARVGATTGGPPRRSTRRR